jgi:CRISPR-associated protein Cmr4
MPTYGSSEEAGGLLFSDAKLMLLPVRSLTSPYVWLTCPHLLERYRRDCERLLGPRKRPALPELKPTDEKVLVVDGPTTGLFLEELVLTVDKTKAPEIGQLADALATLVADDAVKKRLGAEYTENDTRKRDRSQLAVVSDASFTWFARHGLPVMARNVLDEHKVSRNLWYEEALPPDTLLYTLVSERKPGPLAKIRNLLDPPYLQLGGNETVGQGWLKVAFGPGTQP